MADPLAPANRRMTDIIGALPAPLPAGPVFAYSIARYPPSEYRQTLSIRSLEPDMTKCLQGLKRVHPNEGGDGRQRNNRNGTYETIHTPIQEHIFQTLHRYLLRTGKPSLGILRRQCSKTQKLPVDCPARTAINTACERSLSDAGRGVCPVITLQQLSNRACLSEEPAAVNRHQGELAQPFT